MPTHGIRACTPRDTDRVLEIWEAASRAAHSFLPESFLVAERREVRDRHLPMAETWLWEEDRRVLGFVSLIGTEVGALFVDPTSQRRGIGRDLMTFAMERHGALELEVFEENAGARAFYETFGFVVVSGYVHAESGHRILRMRLARPPRGPIRARASRTRRR